MCEATRDVGQCVGTSDAVRPASSFPEPASLRSSPSSDRRTRLGGGGREARLRLPTGAPAHPRGLSEDPPARRSSAPPDLALAGRALPLGPLGLSSLNGGRGALAPASPEAWAGPFQGPELLPAHWAGQAWGCRDPPPRQAPGLPGGTRAQEPHWTPVPRDADSQGPGNCWGKEASLWLERVLGALGRTLPAASLCGPSVCPALPHAQSGSSSLLTACCPYPSWPSDLCPRHPSQAPGRSLGLRLTPALPTWECPETP